MTHEDAIPATETDETSRTVFRDRGEIIAALTARNAELEAEVAEVTAAMRKLAGQWGHWGALAMPSDAAAFTLAATLDEALASAGRPATSDGEENCGTFRDGVQAAVDLACPLPCGGCDQDDCSWCQYVEGLAEVARNATYTVSPSDGEDTNGEAAEDRPHSRACSWSMHRHGPSCHRNCPTCGGYDIRPASPVVAPSATDEDGA